MKQNIVPSKLINNQKIILTLAILSILASIFSACFIESKEQVLFTQGNSIYLIDSDGNNLKKLVSIWIHYLIN